MEMIKPEPAGMFLPRCVQAVVSRCANLLLTPEKLAETIVLRGQHIRHSVFVAEEFLAHVCFLELGSTMNEFRAAMEIVKQLKDENSHN